MKRRVAPQHRQPMLLLTPLGPLPSRRAAAHIVDQLIVAKGAIVVCRRPPACARPRPFAPRARSPCRARSPARARRGLAHCGRGHCVEIWNRAAYCCRISNQLAHCSRPSPPLFSGLLYSYTNSTTTINSIEAVQRVFTKRLPAIQNLPYSQRLSTLKLQTLEHRRLITDLSTCLHYHTRTFRFPIWWLFHRFTLYITSWSLKKNSKYRYAKTTYLNIFFIPRHQTMELPHTWLNIH